MKKEICTHSTSLTVQTWKKYLWNKNVWVFSLVGTLWERFMIQIKWGEGFVNWYFKWWSCRENGKYQIYHLCCDNKEHCCHFVSYSLRVDLHYSCFVDCLTYIYFPKHLCIHLLLCGVLDLRNDCVLWNFLKYITVCMFAILCVNAWVF